MASPPSKRLGKRELGPYASEDRMPQHLHELLAKEDSRNTLPAVVPKLARLLSRDADLQVAYLCTEAAVQVHKFREEGAHFCGYRNMQMLCLTLPPLRNLPDDGAGGKVDFSQKLGVLQLQDLIERAWSQGFNSEGRAQTGGIKGSRKHVGSPEVEALLLSLSIPCTGSSFEGKDAWRKLLDHVEMYFRHAGGEGNHSEGVVTTSRPPIFLQRPWHSVTVVGIERSKQGKRRLLAFDPAWRPPAAMSGEVAEGGGLGWREWLVLERYRVSERSLKRFAAFETVEVDGG